ncbi:SDR family oxidoreductase [Luteolibacter sp. SL250]|uniref:SDR family NAD(P)-dependent oxidoreductase n=1 Tax=Luteolibacter sp. SL250 TaxID=2995170 RepID=UPI00226FADDB|nr:SDR family oxidoreductase [Luteolibacter sp. SL250]WAC19063.1 SDR family oxidoreductase [Luteolibacter sp. SL250]
MDPRNQVTLITGCSSGIGMYLAHQFAKHGHPLILVAPVEQELQQLRTELTAIYGIPVEIIAKDLENSGAAREIYDDLHQRGTHVDILVNNAGHGYHGAWWQQSIDKDLSMVRLNIDAVLRLSKLFVPKMVARGRGILFNTASVAGFEPGPTMAVYHATKAFVLSWSEALSVELENTGVQVTALCPGATDTDFFPKAGMEEARIFQEGNLMAPQDVAEAGYKGMVNGDLIIIPGVINKAMVQGRRILTEKAQANLNAKMYEELPAADHKRNRGDIENKDVQRKR